MAAAAGALGLGKPAAALAALLRAHRLAPKDAAPLIDAAPLLSQAGRGRAALSLLDAAAKLKAPKTQPFGITWNAVSKANRGQALIAAHRYAAAEKTLNAVLKAAPLLREAEQNLAVAEECQGKTDKAKQALFLAVRRQTFAKGDYVGVSNVDPFGQLDAAEVLDTSRGQTLTLPTIKYPLTMDEGVDEHVPFVRLEEHPAGADRAAERRPAGAGPAACYRDPSHRPADPGHPHRDPGSRLGPKPREAAGAGREPRHRGWPPPAPRRRPSGVP
jgi:hypothetical protein